MGTENRIIAGLRDAVAHARGEPSGVRETHVHVPDEIDVRSIREGLGMSQAEFALRFGFSLGTVRGWEQGRRHPEGPARVLLTVIAKAPRAVVDALEPMSAPVKTSMEDDHPFFNLDVPKVLSELPVSMVDLEALVASQRRNIEALAKANRQAVESVQAVAQRQVEIARRAMEEFSAMVRDLASPSDRLMKQAEFSKLVLEKGLSNARELAEMVAKANNKALNDIDKRLAEELAEIRQPRARKRHAPRKVPA